MGNRLSKIYTRTGDDGKTSVETGSRISKNHARIDLLGTLDELNSSIGIILAHNPDTQSVADCLTQIQHDLFNLGGELCPPHHIVITPDKTAKLEEKMDEWNAELPPLKEFILPGGNLKSASCHLARTICRRSERSAVSLYLQETFNSEILRYLNRLSDLLFVAARILARESNTTEVLWEHQRK